MADPPKRITSGGQELVLLDPTDTRLTPEQRQALSKEDLTAIEDELLTESSSIVHAAMSFPEVDDTTEAPPEAWIAALGFKKAEQKLRIAKAAWKSTAEAPVGLKMAMTTFLGIGRLRAGDQQIHQQLNYTVVQLPGPLPSFPEKEVEGRK